MPPHAQIHTYRQELLSALSTTISELTRLMQTLGPDRWHQLAPPQRHTPHQILARLLAYECNVHLPNLQTLLRAYPAPPFTLFDIDHWQTTHYNPQHLTTDLLENLAEQHAALAAELQRCTLEHWNRTHRHTALGPRTLQWWVENLLLQTNRALAALRAIHQPDKD